MEEFKLYSISYEYVEWLREDFPNVYSNKVNARTHTLETRCDLFERE